MDSSEGIHGGGTTDTFLLSFLLYLAILYGALYLCRLKFGLKAFVEDTNQAAAQLYLPVPTQSEIGEAFKKGRSYWAGATFLLAIEGAGLIALLNQAFSSGEFALWLVPIFGWVFAVGIPLQMAGEFLSRYCALRCVREVQNGLVNKSRDTQAGPRAE